jgi:hypothetical protein
MHWFVMGYMVTVLWGNGATEEARTNWDGVFLGTAEQCQARATEYLQEMQARKEGTLSTLKSPSVSHAQQPRKYNKGIVQFNYVSAFCAPFDSEAHILKAFPETWEGMAGGRYNASGKFEAFKWWEGPTAAVIV